MNIRKILVCLGILTPIMSWSQNPQNITLSNTDSGNKTYVAQDNILFLPQYEYQDNSSKLHAYIDKEAAYQPLLTSAEFDQQVVNTSLPVGASRVESSVSETGSGQFSIPIEIPHGTAGMTPSLGLVYNSQGGNGLLGMGWSLSGQSSISLAQDNYYHDDNVQDVAVDGGDRFIMDGMRLYSNSGSYGSNGATYFTDIDSYNKVTSFGSGVTPDWFLVETKAGMTMEYGRSSQSKNSNGNGVTVTWYLNKIYDTYGNYVEFQYWNEGGMHRLEKILYTGNESQGLLPYNTVKFEYTTRTDENTMYSSGREFKLTHVLNKVSIFSDGEHFKTYELEYGLNLHSYLRSITEYGANMTALNSTLIQYGEPGAPIEPVNVSSFVGQGYTDFQLAGDFNADGKSDLLLTEFYYNSQNEKIYTDWKAYVANNHNSFSYYAGGAIPQGYILFFDHGKDDQRFGGLTTSLDFWGDGGDDVLLVKASGTVSQWNGQDYFVTSLDQLTIIDINGYENTYSYSPPIFQGGYVDLEKYLHIGDYDGDGKDDILTLRYGSPLDYTYSGRLITQENGESVVSLQGLAYLHSAIQVLPSDFDGDGKKEIMALYPNSCEIFEFQTQPVSNIYQIDKIYHSDNPGFPTQWHKIFPGDFNGDGKTDILTTGDDVNWFIGYSNGTAYNLQPFTFSHTPDLTQSSEVIRVGDLNGDGKSDIINTWLTYVNQNPATAMGVNYSNGMSFQSEQHDLDYISSVDDMFMGDFNGDGKNEIFNRDAYFDPSQIIYFNRDGQDIFATKVRDGMGKIIEFEYGWITNSTHYSSGSIEAFPVVDQPIAFPVVSKHIIPDGIGGETSMEYSYKGAKWHRQGGGFLGFEEVETTNLTSNISQVKKYELFSDPISPKLRVVLPESSSSKLLTTNELISETDYTYDIDIITGVHVRVNMITSTEIDHLNDITVQTNFTYDNNGNVTQVNSTNGVETSVTTTDYGTFGSWWIPSVPLLETSTITRQGESSYSRITQNYYNAFGKLQQEVADPNLPNTLHTSYAYDGFGNLISNTQNGTGAPSMTEQLIYDGKGRNIIEKVNSADQRSYFEFDPRWSAPIKVTGPNGVQLNFTLSEFGFNTMVSDTKGKSTSISKQWSISDGGTLPSPIATTFYEEKVTSGDGVERTYYDILGRDVHKVKSGSDGDVNVVKHYDNRGNIAVSTTPFFSGDIPQYTYSSYDAFGRQSSVTSGNNTHTWNYSANNGIHTNTLNKGNSVVTSNFDASGKITSSTDQGGTLTFEYHSNGEQKSVALNGQTLISTAYDPYGNQIGLTDMNGGTTSYDYNAYGQLISETSANGEVLNITYDNYGREIEQSLPGTTMQVEYNTDLNGLNKVKTLTGPNGTKEYEYDAFGRSIREVVSVDGQLYETQYQYDNFDRVTNITYPSGLTINLTYHANGGLDKITDATGTVEYYTNVNHNARGQITNCTFGNGVTTTYTYDTKGFLEGIFANGIQDYELEVDQSTGNVLSRADHIKDRKEHFLYDNQNRLIESKITSVSNQQLLLATPLVVNYAGNGNITNKSDVGDYGYDSNRKNALDYVENLSQEIPSIQQDIIYTAFDRVESITEGSLNINFEYDAMRNRIKSELYDNGVLQEKRLYLESFEVIEVSGQQKFVHYLPTSTSSSSVAIVREGGVDDVFYLHKDHLGTIVSVTDESGSVVAEQHFGPWGKRFDPNDWTSSAQNLPVQFNWLRGYTGHEHLDEFGLINMNNRLYDPVVGRMLSVDNFVANELNSQFYNRYSYANNSPMAFNDPSGEFAAPIFIGAGIGAAVGAGVAHVNGDPIWLGAIQGAFYGASFGYGITTWAAGANSVGASKGIAAKIWDRLPRKGLSKTGVVLNVQQAPNAFYTLTNALLTAHVNMASYTLQTLVTGQDFDRNRFWLTGLAGFTSGAIGTSYTNPRVKSILTEEGIVMQNWITATINGGLNNAFTGIYEKDNPKTIVRNTFFGASEGFFAGHMLSNEYLYMSLKNAPYAQMVGFSAWTNAMTSVPGLSSTLYGFYFPIWAGTGNFFDWSTARFLLALATSNPVITLPASDIAAAKHQPADTWYFTQIGNFSIKPFGYFSYVNYFKY